MIRRTPLRKRGRVAERTEARRQEFLAIVFSQSPQDRAGVAIWARTFCGAAVGEDGNVYRHPIGTGVQLPIWLLPNGIYATGVEVGHVHHMNGRNHGQREDMSTFVLLSAARHRAVEDYENRTGKRWEPGCGV